MKYIITESQCNNIIDEFITYQFEPYEEVYVESNPDLINWISDGKIIAQIDCPTYFWVRADIWDLISRMFSLLDYEETEDAIREWLKKHHDLYRLTPERTYYFRP